MKFIAALGTAFLVRTYARGYAAGKQRAYSEWRYVNL